MRRSTSEFLARMLMLLSLATVSLQVAAEDETRDVSEKGAVDRFDRSLWIDPSGIGGSLLMVNDHAPSDSVVDHFLRLTGEEAARIVILRSATGDDKDAGATLARLITRWDEAKAKQLTVVRLEQNDSPNLAQATGVWLLDDDPDLLSDGDSMLTSILTEFLKRGGVIGSSGATAAHFAERFVDHRADSKRAGKGQGWLPGVILDMAGEDAGNNRLPELLQESPSRVGLHIPTGSTLIVHGRQLLSVGQDVITAHWAKGGGRAEAKRPLNRPYPVSDLIALRRAAMDRVLAPFPSRKVADSTVPKGTLVIVGGGGMPKGLIERFVKLAGGKQAKIVVLPTAVPDPIMKRQWMADAFRKAGAMHVTVLPQRKREEVESEAFLDSLRDATGIWFGGGRQWRFVDAYMYTKAHALMQGVLDRGGVIGGSSAGASIQAEYMARGNPVGNLDIMADGYERGLNLLPGAAVDQHFTQRGRLKHMSTLVNRYPQLLGIGVDETTALVVRGQRGEVVGKNRVCFYDRAKQSAQDDPDYEAVYPGGVYDLKERRVIVLGEVPQSDAEGKEKADAPASK